MGFLSKLFSSSSDSRADAKDAAEALFGRTIMVLEPSITIRKVLELMTAQTGANTLTFETTAEFLAGMSSANPDIAILSFSNPDGDVFPIVKQIKSQFAAARIVLLTDISDRIDVATASQHGVDEICLKPFNPVKLLGTLARLVQ